VKVMAHLSVEDVHVWRIVTRDYDPELRKVRLGCWEDLVKSIAKSWPCIYKFVYPPHDPSPLESIVHFSVGNLHKDMETRVCIYQPPASAAGISRA